MPRENRASTEYCFDRLPNEVDLKIPLTPFVKGGKKKEWRRIPLPRRGKRVGYRKA
jgi:hypothetical protein